MRGAIFCLLAILTSFSAAQNPTPVTVAAPAGTIVGQAGRLDSTVDEFLGIPFAEAPTGRLRFEPPVRKPPSPQPIIAQNFGLSCPSFIPSNLSIPTSLTGPEGEDCLSINVWRRRSLKNAPVMVWFYGGGFAFGTSNSELYDGTYFTAHNNVVIATINYRLNVFGFPNSPAVGSENLGFLDQRMAVEWIRDNIAAFGGDPNQIILFGQSAGSVSVDVWSYAWKKDPIVKGFIEQSGVSGLVKYINGGSTYDAWSNLTAAVGCTSGTQVEQLSCMKALDWKTIKSALGPVYNRAGHCATDATFEPPAFFLPRVDRKTVFSADEYERKGKTGDFAKLPLLIGTTDTEITTNGSIPSTPSCPIAYIPGLPKDIDPSIYAAISSSLLFNCPARDQARIRAANGVPVWRYRYFGSFKYPNNILNIGADHGSELPVVFGLAAELGELPSREAKIMKGIQSAWATFAMKPATGLSKAPIGWKQFTSSQLAETLVRLAYGQETKASQAANWYYDAWCEVLDDTMDSEGKYRRRGLGKVRAAEQLGVTEELIEKVKRLTPEQLEVLKRWGARQGLNRA